MQQYNVVKVIALFIEDTRHDEFHDTSHHQLLTANRRLCL